MGKSASKNYVAIGQPTNAQIQELAKNFNLSVQRINLLKQKYNMYRGRNNKINVHNYMVLYREFINANATDLEIFKSFNGFDADRDGFLDFVELLRAVSLQTNQNRTTPVPIAPPSQPQTQQKYIPPAHSTPPVQLRPNTPIPIPPPQPLPTQIQPQIQLQPIPRPPPMQSSFTQLQPLPIEPATLPPVMHVVRRQRSVPVSRPISVVRSRSLSPLPLSSYYYPSVYKRRSKIPTEYYRNSYYHRRSPSPLPPLPSPAPLRRRRVRKITVYVPKRRKNSRSRSDKLQHNHHHHHHHHKRRSLSSSSSSSSPSTPIIYERRIHDTRSYNFDDFDY